MSDRLKECRLYLTQLHGRLEAMDPRRVLERGYAMVTHETHVVTTAGEAGKLDSLMLHFADGSVNVHPDL